MDKEHYLNDIQDIKAMMAKSSQFLSLSGFSGVFAGVYALMGAVMAHKLISEYGRSMDSQEILVQNLLLVAGAVLVASILTAFILTQRKAKRMNETLWGATAQKVLMSFSIPLVTGGLFSLLLISKGLYGIVASSTLIFYGLACISASQHTLKDIKYLGLTEILLGLLALNYMGYGLYFWALGFGICHIFYGIVLYYKYDRVS